MTEVNSLKLDITILNRITSELRPKASEIIRRTAFTVQGKAQQLAPVDTGALKNSLHTEIKDPLMAIVADGVEYGIYQELGTYKMAAHPFLTPAIESERQGWEEAWRELFK
jgi:HK97 gp10 family phage protein